METNPTRRSWTDATEMVVLQCETEFICDPHRRTVEYWHEKTRPTGVSLDDLRLYASQNKWHDKRQAFWRGVQAAYLKQSHMQLIRARTSELKEAQDLQAEIHKQIKPRADGTLAVKPRSYEGMVRAYTAVDALIEGKRDSILASIDPLLADSEVSADEGGTAELPFDAGEMRHVAHSLLQTRLNRRREELAIDDMIDEVEDERDDTDIDAGSETGGSGVESA